MSKKQIIVIVSVIIVIIAMVAIGGVVFFKSDNSQAKLTEVKEDVPGHENDTISLLTGEWVSKEIGSKRPVAVMTENTKENMPQYGLNSAGVIYEAPVEGGITRLMAIYEDFSKLTQMGNVRSCRPYYAHFAKEFDAIYVHFGQSMHAEEMLNSGYVNNLSGLDGSVNATFFRTDEHPAPHNAYTSAEGIENGIEVKGYQREYGESAKSHYTFAAPDKRNKLKDGSDCKKIQLYYFQNHASFVYDEKTKLYQRFEFGEEQIDAVDGKQIAVSNIIFQNVDNSMYEGTPYLNLDVTGSGEGKFFTNGKMIDVTWKKEEDGITRYYDEDGEEITLNTGKTWVCILEKQHVDKCEFSEE